MKTKFKSKCFALLLWQIIVNSQIPLFIVQYSCKSYYEKCE